MSAGRCSTAAGDSPPFIFQVTGLVSVASPAFSFRLGSAWLSSASCPCPYPSCPCLPSSPSLGLLPHARSVRTRREAMSARYADPTSPILLPGPETVEGVVPADAASRQRLGEQGHSGNLGGPASWYIEFNDG